MIQDIIKNTLIEMGYEQDLATHFALKLSSVQKELEPCRDNWLKTQKETDYEVDEFSISFFMDVFQMSYPAALVTVDWLIRDPEKAKKAIKQGIQ